MGPVTFFVLATLLVVAALVVVLHPNPVKGAMALVVTLFLLAVEFVFLSAHMIAALQVIVYAGAIMVLFLFVIMLLNIQDERGTAGFRGGGLTVLASAAGVALAAELVWLFLDLRMDAPTEVAAGYGSAEAVAESLFTDYLFPFELTSILLLVALVGAVLLAQRRTA